MKAFGYTNGQLNGTLVMKRSELEEHAAEGWNQDYSSIYLQEGIRTRAGTYAFDEGGGNPSLCVHGYPDGTCPICMDEVIVVACPYCHSQNGCICSRCFYCGKKEPACTCTRCTRCRNKLEECTCFWYPEPDPNPKPAPQPNPGGGGVNPPTGGDSKGQTSGKVTVTKITSAAEKAAKAALTKFGLSKAACNYGVQTAFNELFTSKELNNKNANTIVDYWNTNSSKWESIEMSKAQELANEGWFVVAGWKASSGSGHVVVIVPGNTSQGNWNGVYTDLPNAMDTGANMKTKSQLINRSFGKTKHKDVQFF